jgi:hypothetical protein
MIPTVAMRQFVAAIGATIAHGAVARDYKVTGAIAGPGAGVGMHAYLPAHAFRASDSGKTRSITGPL